MVRSCLPEPKARDRPLMAGWNGRNAAEAVLADAGVAIGAAA
jgi:hypothetical protein